MNQVLLTGRLVKDVETKSTPSGAKVANFSFAVDKTYKKEGEERGTDFFDIVAWNKTAEFLEKYGKKGRKMFINGSLQVRNYEAKDGTKRKVFEVSAYNVEMLDRPDNGEGRSMTNDVAEPQATDFPDGDCPW